ncbi:MAG TPA: hypothetical protein VMS92_24740 [Mycobacterium sp.]|nr:hypothetical protein [Mycobacterium sp.]
MFSDTCLAYGRVGGRKITKSARAYYMLYNSMHSFLTQSIVVALWIRIYGFEWALLVIPIHLCADRAVFGNFMKSFSMPFERTTSPASAEVQRHTAVVPGESDENAMVRQIPSVEKRAFGNSQVRFPTWLLTTSA